jgi:SNF2 family DNA or RNA helicase
MEALESIIEEAEGMPLLVSYQFRSDLARLQARFPKARTLDQVTEEQWNAGDVPMLLVHPASAGHGLNLQWGSNILVDFSSGWDLEYDQQIIERIGPMRQMQAGLNRPVYRYRIVATNTVDEMVAERRAEKATVQDTLLNAMKRKLS